MTDIYTADVIIFKDNGVSVTLKNKSTEDYYIESYKGGK